MKRVLLLIIALTLVSLHANARDMMQYGRAYLAEGDNAAAVQSYSDLLRLNPFDPVALNNMAVAKAAAGDYRTAFDLLTRAAKLVPNRIDIRENLANLQKWMETYSGVPNPTLERPRMVAPRAAAVLNEPPALWPTARKISNPTLPLPAATR